jgi:hypothetical protein
MNCPNYTMESSLLAPLMILSRTLSGLILATVLCACSGGSTGEQSFTINNTETQKELVAELKKRQIPHRMDETGKMWYPEEHSVVVHEIAYRLMGRSEPVQTTYAYDDPKYTEMFIARLRTADVPFRLTMKQDVTYVVLEMEHKPLWLPIQEEVDEIWEAEVMEKFSKTGIE